MRLAKNGAVGWAWGRAALARSRRLSVASWNLNPAWRSEVSCPAPSNPTRSLPICHPLRAVAWDRPRAKKCAQAERIGSRRWQPTGHATGWRGDVHWDLQCVAIVWIEPGTEAKIGQRLGPQVKLRSLNPLMLAKRVDRPTLRAIMGHTGENMTQRYAGVGDDAKADALVRVRPVWRVVQADGDAEDRKASYAGQDGSALGGSPAGALPSWGGQNRSKGKM